MTPSEYFTNQFYTWEFRGRGWHLSDEPVDIEPPFIPFFRHGYPQGNIDDGKRHTLISKAIEYLQGTRQQTTIHANTLDYESLKPFPADTDQELAALQITIPKEAKIGMERMKALLILLASVRTPVSFEIIGTGTEIIIQLVCDETHASLIETYSGIYFPSCIVLRNDAYISNILQEDVYTMIIDFGLQEEFFRPLQRGVSSINDPLTAIVGCLDRLQGTEQAGIQVLFQPVGNAWDESILRSVTMYDGSSFFYDVPDAPHIAKEKVQSQLFAVVVRVFAQADDIGRIESIWKQVSTPLMIGTKSAHNELVPLLTEGYRFTDRLTDVCNRRSHRLGMLLNIEELLTLVHLPTEPMISKKLFTSRRKTKAAPHIALSNECLLGQNNHNTIETPVTCSIEQRVRHMHIIGATGTGKSTLLANLALQDIAAGIGIVLFDPHGDLVDDIIARIPATRLSDVVLVDPADIDYPIGLNILEAFTDTEKEILSSDLVAIFRRYATSWGDQMTTVLGNAIHAILESTTGGSLHDLRRFLIEKEFRQTVLRTVSDPAIQYYWQKEYSLSKSNSIGPILTRLDTFLRPKAIRNMVSQRSGLDFAKLLNGNKIILLKLSQGLIGKENSFLLGSLILSKIHQAILQRQEQAVRNPVFIYLDEFQHFVTPSVKEMVTGVRKYNAGLILSHQGLHDKDDGELISSILANSSVRVAFRIGESDARRLHDGFSGFEASDLQNLARGEAIVRIDQPQYDCSLTTLPLEQVSPEVAAQNMQSVILYSRQFYAVPKEDVEKTLFDSLSTEPTHVKEESTEKVVQKAPAQQTSHTPESALVISKAIPELPKKDTSTHRYLQMLVKQMAEASGYIATLEMPIPDSAGQVDVVLQKDGKRIAIEICNTTDADWEAHNIQKCLEADYQEVISVSGDIKQLEKIKAKCIAVGFNTKRVLFLTPDALFTHFQGITIQQQPQEEKKYKGYKVNVTYDAISQEEMSRKQAAVAKVVAQSLRKKKSK